MRGALGIEMVGPTDLFEGFRIEFRAPLWEVLGEHRHLLYVTSEPGAGGVLLPAGQGDRWQLGFQPGSAIDPSSDPSTAELEDVVRRVAGVPDLDVRIERTGHFSAAAQLAERFSSGNVFIVGDAAHRVTPRGGTGLNTAIASGYDLGWKLAWVQRGWAPESLLATYEAERRPHAAHNVARSADPMGSRRGAATEVDVDLGGRIRHVWTEPGVTSTLDLVGEGLTLLSSGVRALAGGGAGAPVRGAGHGRDGGADRRPVARAGIGGRGAGPARRGAGRRLVVGPGRPCAAVRRGLGSGRRTRGRRTARGQRSLSRPFGRGSGGDRDGVEQAFLAQHAQARRRSSRPRRAR